MDRARIYNDGRIVFRFKCGSKIEAGTYEVTSNVDEDLSEQLFKLPKGLAVCEERAASS